MLIRLLHLLQPWPRSFLLLGIITAMFVAIVLYRRQAPRIMWDSWLLLLVAVVSARLAYVGQHWDHYSGTPSAILKLWQGGFSVPAGLAALIFAAVVLLWRGRSWRPVVVPIVAGIVIWQGASLIYETSRPSVGLPDMVPLDMQAQVASFETEVPLVINLWATWCPPCRAEMPLLEKAQRANPDIRFIFLNQGESIQTIQDYLDDEGLALDGIVLDPVRAASQQLEARAIPSTYFYDPHGKLVDGFTGELNYPRLEYFLKRLEE